MVVQVYLMVVALVVRVVVMIAEEDHLGRPKTVTDMVAAVAVAETRVVAVEVPVAQCVLRTKPCI